MTTRKGTITVTARKMLFIIAALMLAVVPLAACGEDEVATDELTNPDATLGAQGDLPENIVEANVTISDGQIEENQFVMFEDHSVVLMVTNNDETDYRLRIVDDLVGEQTISAGETTRVEFTTVGSGEYEAQLLGAEADDVLDSASVRVQSASGIDT